MANSEAGMSSDPAQVLGDEYQVFLSFRGPDTRAGFTDFLYHGLVEAGIHVFRDDEELRVGNEIGGSLLHAINCSKIYIPIFSPTYASSRWCLWELARIADNMSKSKGKKSIIPIFLNVEPDDVKLKTPQYENALQQHSKKFPNEVKAWRVALADVGKIKGLKVKSRPAEIVKLVVDMVLEKLETKQEIVTKNLLGLDDRVEHLKELLNVSNPDVLLIGIFGMGGIGKTTIAKFVFNQLSSCFGKFCSFLENVRERSSTEEGIVKLQKKLLLDIGFGSVEKVQDSATGMKRIGETLVNKKILVVLDDIDNKEHIKKLIGISNLHIGSRIIITTRDTTVLKVEGFIGKILRYEMQTMDDSLALQLFCRHAFGQDFPSNDFRALSSEIISYMGGLPLAIEVVSLLLKDIKDKEFWKETLIRLRKVPEEAILEKLRISYDQLDSYQQKIFLDIACFFFNEKKTEASYVWDSCDFYPVRGIKVLTERCLIKIFEGEELWMHDQLIALGRQIVRDKSEDSLGKQSRLWIVEEALKIIKTEKMKDKVQMLQIDRPTDNIEITNEEFERLQNLRCLKLNRGTFVGDFTRCSSNLRWFSWHSPIVMDFSAENLYLDHLVVCKLHDLNFKDDSRAWDLIKRSKNLKILSITSCSHITTIPDISRCLVLEELTLAYCWNLKRIESFIGNLQSLIELKIEMCSNFTDLPKEVGALVKLKHFSLSGCVGLRELPDSFGNLISLTELYLSGTNIAKLPNSIGNLNSLRVLRLSKDQPHHWLFGVHSMWKDHEELARTGELPWYDSERPWYDSYVLPWLHLSKRLYHHVSLFPRDMSMLKNLEELELCGYDEIEVEIPIVIGELSSLKNLNLQDTCICQIPRTINKLHGLQTLNLWNCNAIQELPELPSSLTYLAVRSKSLLSIPDLSNLTNLVELQLSDGSREEHKSNLSTACNIEWIGKLSKLKRLYLNLLYVPFHPKFASLPYLEALELDGLDLTPHEQLPSSRSSWTNLLTLDLYRCKMEDIPLGLPRLENLIVRSSERLQRLSFPSELRNLQQVLVESCPKLVAMQVMGLLNSLKSLTVFGCESLAKIDGLSYLKNLESLQIEGSYVLSDVVALNKQSLQKISPLQLQLRPFRFSCMHYYVQRQEPAVPTWSGRTWKPYNNKIHLYNPDKMKLPFVIEFHLGVKKSTEGFEFVGAIKWEKGDVAPDSVTYRGLIADVNDLGFRSKRMWFRFPGEDHDLPLEIESDEQVKRMVQLASEKGSVRLFVEVGIDICLQGAILWASQRDYSVHLLFFLFALLLSLLLSWIFPGKVDFLNFFSGKSGYYLECVLILLGILVGDWFSLGSP